MNTLKIAVCLTALGTLCSGPTFASTTSATPYAVPSRVYSLFENFQQSPVKTWTNGFQGSAAWRPIGDTPFAKLRRPLQPRSDELQHLGNLVTTWDKPRSGMGHKLLEEKIGRDVRGIFLEPQHFAKDMKPY